MGTVFVLLGLVFLVGIVKPGLLRLPNRWWALSLFIATAVVSPLVSPPVESPVSEEETKPAGEAAPQTTMAEQWASIAQASLGMRSVDFFMQLNDPPTVASAGWTDREGREHTATWPDGSVVITHWDDDLRLDYIEKIGR